jgi:gluconate 2-dehydrogenase gamma chain
MPTKPESPSRRTFLSRTASAMPAVGLLGLGSGALLSGSPAAASTRPAYEPHYFTPAEWAFLNAAVDRLIPANEDGPGGVELGVPEFLDREMDAPYGHGGFWYMQGPFAPDTPPTLGYQLRFTPRDMYRTGIAAVDKWCNDSHSNTFAALDADTRDTILKQLESGEITLNTVPAQAFFNQLLTNTKEGYFADPMYGGNKDMGSWKMIGFPGARADYADWIEQPGKVYPLGPVSIKGARS